MKIVAIQNTENLQTTNVLVKNTSKNSIVVKLNWSNFSEFD